MLVLEKGTGHGKVRGMVWQTQDMPYSEVYRCPPTT
jgi:hypothetical protein